MKIWTDILSPAEATGIIREAAEARESATGGSLARFLPNDYRHSTFVRLVIGESGLVDEAKFRALDAEPEFGARKPAKRVNLDLPAIGRQDAITEWAQLIDSGASEDVIRDAIVKTLKVNAEAIVDRIERLRGTVLATGKATIAQDNFQTDDDFGRSADLNTTAATLWTDAAATILDDLAAWQELYTETNGVEPGTLLVSSSILRAMAVHTDFANVGGKRASRTDIQGVLDAYGLPVLETYSRFTAGGRVLPAETALFLPAAVGEGDTSPLGSTVWGRTLTSTDASFDIPEDERPGIVAAAYRAETVPMVGVVQSDAIALPILEKANLSLAAKVIG